MRFLGRQGGFLTASTVMAAVGMAWGLYDSLRGAGATPGAAAPGAAGAATTWPPAAAPATAPTPPPGVPGPAAVPEAVARIVRLAASAAGADGDVAPSERALILQHARDAGVEALVDGELQARRPLTEIVAGVTSEAERRDLYVLAFTIVRADETVSGAERIYLAQLAHALGLAATAVAALEAQTVAAIDAADGPAPATA